MEIVASQGGLSSSDAVTPDLLMRGMAHDLANMLAVISSGLSMLERGDDQPRRPAILKGMNRAVLNAATLAKNIVSLSGDNAQAPAAISLGPVIDGMAVLVEGAVGPDIMFDASVADDVWPVRAVRTYLEFALLNLIVNASDAMPNGGVLRLRASNARGTSSGLLGSADDIVRIEVIDTGEGIPESILARVFEPFFTTKPPMKGTGLGLGQVRRFAEQHGGEISIESVVGKGTRAILSLPRARSGHGPR